MTRKYRSLIYGIILGLCLCGCTGKGDSSSVPVMEEGFQPDLGPLNSGIKTESDDMISGSVSDLTENPDENKDTDERSPQKNAHEDSSFPLNIVMVGDVLLHDGINQTCRLEDGSYDYSGIFKNVRKEIREADIAIVNQEVIIGGKELKVTGYPSFNAPYEIADELAATGFNVVCHATNHVYDRGETGLVNCLNYWDDNYPDIKIVGISDSQRDNEPVIIEEKGIKVAILNYTYGTNGVNISGGERFSVNRLKEDEVISDLIRAEKSADFTIVCPHWGIEYDHIPSDEQVKWSEIFLENGADLVIGTHPHVIQPVKWMEDKVSGHRMLIYYSLGNFVNWTSGKGQRVGDRLVGGMARVRVSRNARGQVMINDHDVEALVTHLSKYRDELTVYRLKDYPDRLIGSNMILENDASFSKAYCEDLCNEVWGDEWR